MMSCSPCAGESAIPICCPRENDGAIANLSANHRRESVRTAAGVADRPRDEPPGFQSALAHLWLLRSQLLAVQNDHQFSRRDVSAARPALCAALRDALQRKSARRLSGNAATRDRRHGILVQVPA